MALNLKEIIEGMSGKRVRQILNENMQATVDEAAAVAAAAVGTIRGEVDGLTSKVARFMGSVVKAEDANQIGVWYVMGQTGYPGGVLAYSKAMGTQTVTQTLISPSSPIYDASGAIYAWEAKPCILVRQLLNGGWSTWQIVGEDRLKDVESKVGEIALKVTETHPKIDEKGFYLIDEENRIAAQYTKDGFDVAKLSAHFESLVKAIEGIGLVIGESVGTAYDGKKGKDTADALTRLTGVVQDLKNVFANVSERGFFFTDSSDLVGFKYDANGFDAAKVSSHFKSLVGSGGGGGGGLSENAKTLLIQILQSGVYVNADSNDKINQLLVELNK